MRSQQATRELRETLVKHALDLVQREGPSALTMRALAREAGCAVGLPYKVFTDRTDLVAEMMRAEFVRLRAGFDELVERAGSGTVGGNLAWFAELLLDSPAVGLADEVHREADQAKATAEDFHASGIAAAFETGIPDYLAAEQRAGRIDPDVDTAAFGFVIVGAMHNLLASGPAYPRPNRRRLRRILDAVAAGLAP